MFNRNPEDDKLLARPMKHKVKPRFYPYEIVKRFIRSIVPIENRSTELFASQNKLIEKYTPPDKQSTTASRWVLQAKITPRLVEVLRPFVRKLTSPKKEEKNLGLALLNNLARRIPICVDNFHFHNVFSFMAGTGDPALPAKEIKYFFPSGDRKRLRYLAKPKKIHPPPKLPKRKKKNLTELVNYILKLAKPKWVYKTVSQDSMVKKMGVSRAARNCIPNDRTLELAKNVPWKMVEEPFYFHGIVTDAALNANMTSRLEFLSISKEKGRPPNCHVNENPNYINPLALKYEPTPRMLELAKPKVDHMVKR